MDAYYRLLADAIVVAHFAYVAFILAGLVLVPLGWWREWGWIRAFWLRVIHFSAMAYVAVEAWLGIPCPLTTWESSLRHKAGQAGYPGDFIGYWAHELLFYDAPPWVFTAAYTAVALLIVLGLFLAPPRWPRWLPYVKRKSS